MIESTFMRTLALFILGCVVWWGSIARVFTPPGSTQFDPNKNHPLAQELLANYVHHWQSSESRDKLLSDLHAANPEWDLMFRLFLVGALANAAERDARWKKTAVTTIDVIIRDTLQKERQYGQSYFLLPYAAARPFVVQSPAGNQFVDGEIAWMMGMRRLLHNDSVWRKLHRDRVALIERRMRRSALLSAESYPDENWVFCNTVALAAIRMYDTLEGSDHSELFTNWLTVAQSRLSDSRTGLLISSYRFNGTRLDGPEGSSIWMSAHNLSWIDPRFGRTQYDRARSLLGRSLFGFGYAREWPPEGSSPMDIDSGVALPLLGAGPSSSAMSLLGAVTFADDDFAGQILASLNFGAFPVRTADGLRYQASNALGDSVIMYALLQGAIRRRALQSS